MEIKLDEKYYALSDKHQYILGEKSGDRILHISFFASFEGLLNNYMDIRCRTKENIKTIQNLLDYQNSVLASLNKALHPLKIKVDTYE